MDWCLMFLSVWIHLGYIIFVMGPPFFQILCWDLVALLMLPLLLVLRLFPSQMLGAPYPQVTSQHLGSGFFVWIVCVI